VLVLVLVLVLEIAAKEWKEPGIRDEGPRGRGGKGPNPS